MTAGSTALAGDPETAKQIGGNLKLRSLGADIFTKLMQAVGGLGGQSGSAVSVERILTTIQASSGPANLTQAADQAWGTALGVFGMKADDIKRRAKQARAELASANTEVSKARERLSDFDDSQSSADDASRRRGLVSAIHGAEEAAAGVQQRLKALDEERRGADSAASKSIAAQRAQYVAARNALPDPPTVSAGVTVSVRMPDGTVQRVSAVSLARLKDPSKIRSVWDAMTEEQRQQLTRDFPALIGNLDGIPLRDRNTANVITAKAYRRELEKQIEMLDLLQKQPGVEGVFADKIASLRGEVTSIDAILGDRNGLYQGDRKFGRYTVYDEDGNSATQQGTTLVGFNPLRDSIVTFQGALDPKTGDVPAWMQHVGVSVPGTNSKLSGFTDELTRGKHLMSGSGKKSGYFVWHGAPMPQFELPKHIIDPAERGFADIAAPRLASFVNSLRLGPDTEVVPVAHSYGAAVLGGAEYLGLSATRVVYVAPAGLGHNVGGIEDFPNTKDVPHFVLQARNDTVVGWNQGKLNADWLALGHGPTDPLEAPGIVRLETGYLDADDPAKGTIESLGGIKTHSTPFEAKSTSMQNITGVVKGDPVSLYHPNDTKQVRIDGRVPRSITVDVRDSGAAKPEEKISSVDLSKVR